MRRALQHSKLVRVLAPLGLSALLLYACGDDANTSPSPTGTPDSRIDGSTRDAAKSDGAVAEDEDAATTKDSGKDATIGDAKVQDGQVSDAEADADVDGGWPDCSTKPPAAPTKTISDVWTDNATTPTQVWLPNVYVTAVSRGGCSPNQACQLYVQSATTFASLAAGAHQAIKVFVSASRASNFTGIAPGDQVDVLGFGWRYDLDSQNEILVQVNSTLPGCMKKVGTGTLVPVDATVDQLTRASYEVYGPLLVKVATVSGKAQAANNQTFGLYPTGFDGGFGDAGSDIVSLSPFFLPNAQFTNPPVIPSVVNTFSSVVGVFGLFTPFADGGAPTYLEIYPRTAADLSK